MKAVMATISNFEMHLLMWKMTGIYGQWTEGYWISSAIIGIGNGNGKWGLCKTSLDNNHISETVREESILMKFFGKKI